MIVSSVPTSISVWDPRRGGCRLGTLVRLLLPEWCRDNMVVLSEISLGPCYHFQFQLGSVNGASGCDGIA
jgi:hypothetical protein